ncbi:MAG TPA: histidine kinase [Terracidiphilus sp.]|jgi:two-component system, LytTR family, sensor kinase|nr:histidine kinase [Terracidiphilus sp.]
MGKDASRHQPVFMNPAIFIGSWVLLGLLFGLQEWLYMHRWGYHQIGAAIVFESWGVQFFLWGIISWLFWKYLCDFIQNATSRCLITRVLPLSAATSLLEEMIWVVFFPQIPLNHPHMPYWQRLAFQLNAEFFDNMVIFWCAFGFFRGIIYYQRYREKEKAAAQLAIQLSHAKISALRMQLNPHFLFNVMNSISSLMRTDLNAADAMLEQLSSLLRITLERGDVQLIPLREEMEFIEIYLAMQGQRYAGRVKQKISVEPELHDALVPAMILQPIVENAYMHGLCKVDREGELLVDVHRRGNQISASVVNTGMGLGTNGCKSSERVGVGLANVRSRLQLHYGESGAFMLRQLDPTHVEAAITLPLSFSAASNGNLTGYGE